ncbi:MULTISPECIES: hypothetical protein [Microbacterium]|uniref:hypothetical protein n=1 Tax=Microbacterium TaxID=33882 RepID=UPI00277D8B8F|nr:MULTISPECIES: hypothetical protein [Microbacterium]MDQ1084182.1 YD repeat-containing protein [Microbacterium sp. SORGH_AS_0344]MDQ1170543.1 YD repeat-containing protein [Microbacterium proteolyticum]
MTTTDRGPITDEPDQVVTNARAREAFEPAFAPTSITYDSAGRILSATRDGITTTYTYNANGTVATDTRLGITRTYTYDDAGHLVEIGEN